MCWLGSQPEDGRLVVRVWGGVVCVCVCVVVLVVYVCVAVCMYVCGGGGGVYVCLCVCVWDGVGGVVLIEFTGGYDLLLVVAAGSVFKIFVHDFRSLRGYFFRF